MYFTKDIGQQQKYQDWALELYSHCPKKYKNW